MERIGLLDRYIAKIASDWEAFDQKENTPEAKEYQAGLHSTLKVLKDLGAARDPRLILLAEKVTLQQELATYANAPEMINSIKPALQQIAEASATLQLVRDHNAYAQAAVTYSSKRKQAGLPMDAFREFAKSHTARLTNRLKASSSVSEKNILRQRKENLKVANQKYMLLQREALGLAPEAEQELTR